MYAPSILPDMDKAFRVSRHTGGLVETVYNTESKGNGGSNLNIARDDHPPDQGCELFGIPSCVKCPFKSCKCTEKKWRPYSGKVK